MSSGISINTASDDPAGLIISEQMRSQIASLNQGISNISRVIYKYDTADSNISELRSILIDIRSNALGAANTGGNDPATQEAYNNAVQFAVDTYNRIVTTTQYGEAKLLDGSEGSAVNIDELADVDLTTAEGAEAAMQAVDKASAQLDQVQGELGARIKYELRSQQSSLEISLLNLVLAESDIRDTDFASEFMKFTKAVTSIEISAALMAHAFLAERNVLSLVQSNP
ncbi:MAG: hypothetical protein IIB00_03645 [candidate division Zixibacteria bacterium]|nr:hypothetical protein [candidate division Zixibacteria bacterium]